MLCLGEEGVIGCGVFREAEGFSVVDAHWERGQLVELDGLLAVVVGTDADSWVPKGHVALWFGEPRTIRKSQGGPGGLQPEVWTVPAEYCVRAANPKVRH